MYARAFLRSLRIMKHNAPTRITIAAAPIPIPAFAPVLRPVSADEDWLEGIEAAADETVDEKGMDVEAIEAVAVVLSLVALGVT